MSDYEFTVRIPTTQRVHDLLDAVWTLPNDELRQFVRGFTLMAQTLQLEPTAQRDTSNQDRDPAISQVTPLPVCRECAKGHHIYCLDDGSSTVTCRCTCGDESRPASTDPQLSGTETGASRPASEPK